MFFLEPWEPSLGGGAISELLGDSPRCALNFFRCDCFFILLPTTYNLLPTTCYLLPTSYYASSLIRVGLSWAACILMSNLKPKNGYGSVPGNVPGKFLVTNPLIIYWARTGRGIGRGIGHAFWLVYMALYWARLKPHLPDIWCC